MECPEPLTTESLTARAVETLREADYLDEAKALAARKAVSGIIARVASHVYEDAPADARVLDVLAALWLTMRGGRVLDLPTDPPPPPPERT